MEIGKIDHSFQAKLASAKKIDAHHQFKQILNRELGEIDAAGLPSPVDSKTDLIEQGDKILNLLDDYTKELSDPARKLKDIAPLVNRIEKEVTLIEANAGDKIHKDKALERFIKDLAVTANVAAYKFHRGDYI